MTFRLCVNGVLHSFSFQQYFVSNLFFLSLLCRSEQKLLHLVGGDLSDCDKLFGQLKSLVSPKFGVLFLCEVSLVYLPTEKSDAILTLIAKVSKPYFSKVHKYELPIFD